jgi:hypothetical protein
MYWPNDVGAALRDNGSAWETVWAGTLGALTKPPSAGWSTTTLGSATEAADLDGRLLTVPSAAGTNWRLAYRSLAATSNYTAAAYLDKSIKPVSNAHHSGLVLRESSSGKLISMGLGYDTGFGAGTAFYVMKWTSPTVFSATFYQVLWYQGDGTPQWWRFRDDGTNRYYECSANGVDWITLGSETRITFMTADQIGYGMNNNSGNTGYIRLRSLTGV